ncbi:MAG: leucyl/phenylalanyl-tRNA--protein transferase [Thiotrichales bacterium]
MLSPFVRRAARILLPRVSGGLEVGEQIALDAFGFNKEAVIKAYVNGYFPMPDAQGRVHWLAPARRCLIPIESHSVPKNLARLVRQRVFEIRVDTAFDQVIRACAERRETWINDEFIRVYNELHEMGVAHSVEAWQGGALVGGLYGVAIGRFFATESQFHRVRDAGKVAFVHTFQILRDQGFKMHDVQFQTAFLEQFGSVEISLQEYRQQLMREIVQSATFRLPEDLSEESPLVGIASARVSA